MVDEEIIMNEKMTKKEMEDYLEKIEDVKKGVNELIEEEKKLKAERLLAGNSEAGSTPLKKKEMTNEEYAMEVFKGKINPLTDAPTQS